MTARTLLSTQGANTEAGEEASVAEEVMLLPEVTPVRVRELGEACREERLGEGEEGLVCPV